MRVISALAGLLLAGCSLGADPGPLAQLDSINAPDMVVLAGKIQTIFKAVKLTGYPRVSQLRRPPVTALGDWMVCLRSDAETDPQAYTLLIHNGDIVDYRLALAIDGCANERFGPLPTPTVEQTKRPK